MSQPARGYLPPETATRRNPFREWIGARLRVDVYGWARRRRPGACGAHGARRTRASATRRTASTPRCSWRRRTPRRSASTTPPSAPTSASRSSRARAASPRRCASRADSTVSGRLVVDALYERYGGYHWVHAINNTALVAAALYAFDDFRPAICGVVAGRLGHRHERRGGRLDLRCAAARSSGAGRSRCTAGSRARCRASTASTLDELARAYARGRMTEAARSARRRARSTCRPPIDGELDTREDHRRARRPGRLARVARRARARGATRPSAPATTAAPTSGSTLDAELLLGRARLALGRAALRPRRAAVHARAAARRGRARVRRLRRRRALARLSGDRHRRAQPVRLVPRRARASASSSRRSSERGVRVFVDYNPWDIGTRREPVDDADGRRGARARRSAPTVSSSTR